MLIKRSVKNSSSYRMGSQEKMATFTAIIKGRENRADQIKKAIAVLYHIDLDAIEVDVDGDMTQEKLNEFFHATNDTQYDLAGFLEENRCRFSVKINSELVIDDELYVCDDVDMPNRPITLNAKGVYFIGNSVTGKLVNSDLSQSTLLNTTHEILVVTPSELKNQSEAAVRYINRKDSPLLNNKMASIILAKERINDLVKNSFLVVSKQQREDARHAYQKHHNAKLTLFEDGYDDSAHKMKEAIARQYNVDVDDVELTLHGGLRPGQLQGFFEGDEEQVCFDLQGFLDENNCRFSAKIEGKFVVRKELYVCEDIYIPNKLVSVKANGIYFIGNAIVGEFIYSEFAQATFLDVIYDMSMIHSCFEKGRIENSRFFVPIYFNDVDLSKSKISFSSVFNGTWVSLYGSYGSDFQINTDGCYLDLERVQLKDMSIELE